MYLAVLTGSERKFYVTNAIGLHFIFKSWFKLIVAFPGEITLNIKDINDNAPEFIQVQPNFGNMFMIFTFFHFPALHVFLKLWNVSVLVRGFCSPTVVLAESVAKDTSVAIVSVSLKHLIVAVRNSWLCLWSQKFYIWHSFLSKGNRPWYRGKQ